LTGALVERDFNFYMDFLYDVVKAYDIYEKEHIQKTHTSVFDKSFAKQ